MNSPQTKTDFERNFDVINLIFGAALSAYVGVILADKNLNGWEITKLTAGLVGLAIAIINGRSVIIGVQRQPLSKYRSMLFAAVSSFVSAIWLLCTVGQRPIAIIALMTAWLLLLSTYMGFEILIRDRERQRAPTSDKKLDEF